jgi:tetratricopeptide (TPR) repeat protein
MLMEPTAMGQHQLSQQLLAIEALITRGRTGEALEALARMEVGAADDPAALQRVAQLYLHCAGFVAAARCHERAAQLLPDDARVLYNLASSCTALGDLERAYALYTRVIERDPGDAAAWLNRSLLQVWTVARNHIDGLRAALSRLPSGHAAAVPLCYALAKEHEDLGEAAVSFAYLRRGADQRRAALAYRVDGDVAAMAQIAATFDARLLATAAPPRADERSYFVLGLPRSGTTLVERILGSHSHVGSLGEINNFVYGVMRLAAGGGGKSDMIARAARIDFAALGRLYREGIAGYGDDSPALINKTPDNFLYLGLIRMALPGARVIHLRRHPLDSCLAMYKTLFRMGYPYSYSLEDLGHYYLAYHRLMHHWRDCLPDAIHEVDYEALVGAQEASSRALLAYCGLAWEPACLEFHRNPAPSATASAAQVRQPLHRRSVQRWHSYAEQLAPLAEFLTAHGVDCGDHDFTHQQEAT